MSGSASMPKVTCTRMELLAIKAQINLARQGRDLLELKRTALMKEFLRTADIMMEHTETLQRVAQEASLALARAEAAMGKEAVLSAALATRAELSLEITTANLMGVKVPHIGQKQVSRPVLGRGYSIVGTSTRIDEAASTFEAEVEAILRLAESELRLSRLGAEIQRTSRRLNALENLVIPALEDECNIIQFALDERERADHFRFKLMKRILEHKRGAL